MRGWREEEPGGAKVMGDAVGCLGCFPTKAGTQTGLPPSRENKEAGGIVWGGVLLA